MKKIVGIIGRQKTVNERDYLVFYQELVSQIYNHNCLPLGILLNYKTKDYKYFIDMCDGIILEGGSDEHEIDSDIVKYIYNKNIPVLGICLGMQMMGKAMNGNISNIGNLNHEKMDQYVHSITINKNSKLSDIINKEKIMVNSRHADNVTNTDLFISAISDDGIIEAVEDKNKRYFVGVEWHPESINDENSENLFTSFFDEVKKMSQ